ncbi:MAG TPA: ABC transporter substrate-binding protein [Methylomirabilota bacterium]|nr:ABC transporter substrate-binding protein [Methylomirabilota bacterium]
MARPQPSSPFVSAIIILSCAIVLVSGAAGDVAAQAKPGAAYKPEGEMRWALYVTLAPAWFDPGDVAGFITPFWVLYAIHDAVVKPMPGNLMTPSLAESWTVSKDQLVYEFKLRQGLKFHNGDPFTAEDVKFSFLRAKSSKIFKDKVREVEVASPHRVRFHLHEPFPDFMAFYGTLATGASWVVPKKYVEKVGPDGFKKHPIGLGPYKFVSHTPGVELVMEAFEGYWRKMPHVKRLVFKSVPEATTRAAMLKNGEVDIAYLLDAPTAMEIKRDPRLTLAFSGAIGIHFLEFFDQWDPKSPWHDRRVRLAANYAIDRRALNEAETLSASRLTGGMVPRKFEFALSIEPYPYDPAKAKQLLAEAGFPNGFDGGDFYPYPPYFSMGETIAGYLAAVGIRTRFHTMERAAFQTAWRNKKLRGICSCITAQYGNAATRLADLVTKEGVLAVGHDPDVDALFKRQARETDRGKREAMLHQLQHLIHERVRFGPIWEYIWPSAIGPRVAEPALLAIDPYPWSAPLEDVRLKP